MQTSANYALKLMEGTDNVKRQDFVDNFTSIDTQMKAINDNSYPDVTATGTNTYVGTTDRITALAKGTKLTLFVGTDATGNCTLNLNSYGAKSIKDSFGNVVTNLKANIPYNVCYNGTDFILQGKGGGGNTIASHVLNGDTFTSDSGQGTGTMNNQSSTTNGWCGYETITVQPHPSDSSQGLVTIPNTCNVPGYYDSTSKVTGNLASLNAANIKAGVVIGRNGGDSSNSIVGAFTSDATASAGQILNGQTAYVNANKVTGSMPNLTGVRSATGVSQWGDGGLAVYPEQGYQKGGAGDGEIKVSVAQLQSADGDLAAGNIVSGKNIFGIDGAATIASLGGKKNVAGTFTGTGASSYTIDVGFTIQYLLLYVSGRIYGVNNGYSSVPSFATLTDSYNGTVSSQASISENTFTLSRTITSGTNAYYIAIGY